MEQLKLLMDYTKFHIGVYLTLGSVSLGLVELQIVDFTEWIPTIIFLIVAGAAGGVIGSHIPNFETFKDFEEAKLGFWGMRLARYRFWAKLEHVAFWMGILWGSYILLTR
ncbi:MAG: hypothetical protein AAF959_23085 [Cyanobacteria bacterium P01_D01_bin.56]